MAKLMLLPYKFPQLILSAFFCGIGGVNGLSRFIVLTSNILLRVVENVYSNAFAPPRLHIQKGTTQTGTCKYI
jgi:hypothetical protein